MTNATGSIGTSTAISISGPASLTNNIGSGTFTATVSLASLSGLNITAPFKITLSGADSISGTITVPLSLLTGGGTSSSGTGSLTITGGTGAYAGATGSFPTITGSGSLSGANVTLSFSGAGTVFTGGSGGPPPPTITAVLDGASYSRNVAQGSLFIVKGSGLSSAAGLNQFSFPLPTNPGGIKITFTPAAGGAGTDAYMVYTYNQGGVNQLAAILPSTVPAGSYNVSVNNNGAISAGFATQVVQRKPTLITRDSSGSGLAVIQIFTSATAYSIDASTNAASGTAPAKPGSVLVAWATGMGPISGSDNTASPGVNFATGGNVQVIVGGTSFTPDYAGRAPGLAGADQINFTLPANVATGCTVSFQISVNGVMSNPTYISIVPDASTTACTIPGLTAAQLQKFDQGGTFTWGDFTLAQLSETLPSGAFKIAIASGGFTQINAFQLSSPPQTVAPQSQSGACQVIHIVGSQSQVASGIGSSKLLDAGAVTLNGPAGSNISNMPLTEDPDLHSYTLLLTNGINVGGTYSLTGAGGNDVGKFNASVNLGSPLTITNGLPSTVIRSAGLPLSWTGGNASDLVEIIGFAGTTSGTGTNLNIDATEFICTSTAGAGSFTVPSSILLQLPAISPGGPSGSTFLEVASVVSPTNGNGLFTAPLTAGGSIDSGFFLSVLGATSSPSFQ